jgi:hypothetical protein
MEVLDVSIIVANIAITIGSVVAILQLLKFVKSTKADHERRQKQSTIEFFHNINRDTFELLNIMKKEGLLIESHLTDAQIIEKIESDSNNLRAPVTRYLDLMNRLSVGIISKVYDIEIFSQMVGKSVINTYEWLEPYIGFRRKKIKRPTLYSDLEEMVGVLKIMNKPLCSKGTIQYS